MASPVPTHTWVGSDGLTATAPMEPTRWEVKRCSYVIPRLVVCSRPPVAWAIQASLGRCGFTAMSVMRPPMLAGPTLRQSRASAHSSGRVPSTFSGRPSRLGLRGLAGFASAASS